jgi:hypothetical protein
VPFFQYMCHFRILCAVFHFYVPFPRFLCQLDHKHKNYPVFFLFFPIKSIKKYFCDSFLALCAIFEIYVPFPKFMCHCQTNPKHKNRPAGLAYYTCLFLNCCFDKIAEERLWTCWS